MQDGTPREIDDSQGEGNASEDLSHEIDEVV